MKRILMICAVLGVAIGTSAYVYNYGGMTEPVAFYSGHTHVDGGTQGAPAHSGGTNAAGCHNASVPYHCH
ncbi:hypothetical protein QMT40_001773 [Parvibaculaceae bacterium PLY_AMNH_Bact1]|nr:hypothetical protein QMT40_001773 [Parvibaculaceae bacterium PLY_AMNH_Bact1]